MNEQNVLSDIENINEKYIAWMYKNAVWFGNDDVLTDNDDIWVNFLHGKDAYTYFLPDKIDTYWVLYKNIIYAVSIWHAVEEWRTQGK